MSTPVINAIDNVNQTSLNNLFASVAANPTARDNLSRSNRNIDKVSQSPTAIRGLNNNADAIRKMLCRREGRDPSNFSDLTSVVTDQSLIQDIAARQTSARIVGRSVKAMNAAVSSQTAMQEIAASQPAMQEIAAETGSFNAVATSSIARTEIENSQTAIDVLNAQTTSFSDTDNFTLASGPKQVNPMTNSNGVWVETATSVAPTTSANGEHFLRVVGDGTGVSNPNSTTERFVFDVEQTSNDTGNEVTTSGQKYRP